MRALRRTSVLAAGAWTKEEYGGSEWQVADQHLDAKVLRQRIAAIADGRIDTAARLGRAGTNRLAPSVVVRPEASHSAPVLEVRTDDRPRVVHAVFPALAGLRTPVRPAPRDTLRPQALDVFYRSVERRVGQTGGGTG